MRRLLIGCALVAGAAAAVVVVREARPRAPVAAAPVAAGTAAAAATTPTSAGGELGAMLAAGRRARYEAPVATAERRRALDGAIAHGSLDERRRALAALTLEDRAAADDAARGLLADRALFADAARVLLLRPDGAPASADVTRVRRALRTGLHDEGSRAAVTTLVLDTLVRHRSPEAARFAAATRR